MGARSGEQFLERLRSTKRQLWLEGELVDDVTAHPALAGAARTQPAGHAERRQLDHAEPRPLLDEFLHGARGSSAEERAALFRLAWDFIGSSLGGRNVLYERFYLTSAARNRINNHLRHTDRSRAYALVDGILAAGRQAADRGR